MENSVRVYDHVHSLFKILPGDYEGKWFCRGTAGLGCLSGLEEGADLSFSKKMIRYQCNREDNEKITDPHRNYDKFSNCDYDLCVKCVQAELFLREYTPSR